MPGYDIKITLLRGNTPLKKIAYYKSSYKELTVGRKDYGADFQIPEDRISRGHAKLLIEKGQVSVMDTSVNGTFIDGQRVPANRYYPISNKSRVKFGPTSNFNLLVEYFNQQHKRRPSAIIAEDANDGIIDGENDLSALFDQKVEVWIGRSKECDLVIPSLTISRKHTAIRKLSEDQYMVTDMSSNGTYVNGRRINGSQKVGPNDVITIGDREFQLSKAGDSMVFASVVLHRANKVAIQAYKLAKVYDNGYKALQDVSFNIYQGDFAAIMGPSGCGKSTLLKALNGANPATGGKGLILGKELVNNYDYIKKFIGYVPQDDIVHKELSVESSLYYAAKLRLASDVTEEEIEDKIDEVLSNLNINSEEIKQTKVGDLSGGQRKRVSIAVELLTDPLILFLDEPTSPLDPETIEEFLQCLKDLNANNTTIMMVTHKPSDLEFADKVIFLSKGGYLTFYGGEKELLDYFGTNRINEIYSKNKTREAGKKLAGRFDQVRKDKHLLSATGKEIPLDQKEKDSFFKQLYWLTARYLNIKINDPVNMLIMLGQAPIIALLMILVFDKLTIGVLFLTTICAIWFGSNNAAKEIVSELPIYIRERMFNLRLFPYILSKISVLTLFSIIQVLLFTVILYFWFNWDEVETSLNIEVSFFPFFLMMLFLAFSGTIMGLLLSTMFNKTEKVMTFLPLILIPQIMFSGVVTPIISEVTTTKNGKQHTEEKLSANELLSYFTFARWGVDAYTDLTENIRIFKPISVEQEKLCIGTCYKDSTQTSVAYKIDTIRNTYDYIKTPDAVKLPNMLMKKGLGIKEESSLFWGKVGFIGLLDFLMFIGIMILLKRKDTI